MKQKVLSFGGAAPAVTEKRQPSPPPRRRRRTGRQLLNYLLLILIATAVMLTLSVTVLFNVNRIEVEGQIKYAPEALIETSGVKTGDNLLRINERVVRKRILEKYPYVEDVHLKRALPDKLILDITPATLLGACETDTGYVILSDTGRILETEAAAIPGGLMVVSGMYLYEPAVGKTLGTGFDKEHEKEEELERDAFAMLSSLVKAVEDTDFEKITMVDFSDRLNMILVYDSRVFIELGSQAELSYKLNFADYVIHEQLPQGFQGILDASYCNTSKEVRTRACDIQEELKKRRGIVEEPDDTSQGKEDKKTNGEKDTKKDSTSSDASSSSQEEDPYNAVIPKASSSSEDTQDKSSSEASSSGSSSNSDKKASSGTSASSKESSSSSESSASSEEDESLYSPEDLEVVPSADRSSEPSEG